MNAEAYIRKHIRKILLEKEEEKEKKKPAKIRSVGVGRGRLKFSVTDAGALAKEDPGKLMSNLKISGVKKNKKQLELLTKLLEDAASGTDEMSEVFTVPSKQPTAKDKDGNEIEAVSVKVSVVPPRDVQKYIEFTILGATNAFGIKWDKDVEVTRSGDNIVVYLK